MEARARVIELAAFLDRVERAEGVADFRLAALHTALTKLEGNQPNRAANVLMALSDPTDSPIPEALGKGATGAWAGNPTPGH